MDKINLNNKRKNNQINKITESITYNKSTTNIKKQKAKIEFSLPIIEIFYKHIENLKSFIKKHFFQDSNHYLFKQINNIISKIDDIIKELDTQICQYQNIILYNESKIRNLQGDLFTELLNNEILQNNLINLVQKEKDYELIKEKTGIIVNDGKIINTNRKDNEIIILRTENSTLKGVIEQYEIKLSQKEKEYNKKKMNLIKEKKDLISKIHLLNQEIKKKHNSNYSRYNIAKKKLNINNKKSSELSGTNLSESNNDIIINNNNNPSTINILQNNDNNYYIENPNKFIIGDIKMNTISATHIQTINHSHKNSSYNTKIKDQFKKFEKDNNNYINIKDNEKVNKTIINKTFNPNQKLKLNKRLNTNKPLKNNIYNRIIVKDNLKNDFKNKIIKTDRTKTKSHEHHISNIENIFYKNNKNFNTYFINNKKIKKIIHKKTNSNKISTIPFNVDKKDYNSSNKENNKNQTNLVNIKNLILNKGQKMKKSKIHLIYRNIIPNSISNTSNTNSNNNSRNFNLRNNVPKLNTFYTSKVPTPKSFANY